MRERHHLREADQSAGVFAPAGRHPSAARLNSTATEARFCPLELAVGLEDRGDRAVAAVAGCLPRRSSASKIFFASSSGVALASSGNARRPAVSAFGRRATSIKAGRGAFADWRWANKESRCAASCQLRCAFRKSGARIRSASAPDRYRGSRFAIERSPQIRRSRRAADLRNRQFTRHCRPATAGPPARSEQRASTSVHNTRAGWLLAVLITARVGGWRRQRTQLDVTSRLRRRRG